MHLPFVTNSTEMYQWKTGRSFSAGSDGKESACNAGELGAILGWEDPLEKGMVTHSSVLARRIPWTEEPGRLQSIGSQRVGHDSSDLTGSHAQTSTSLCTSFPPSDPSQALTLSVTQPSITLTNHVPHIKVPISQSDRSDAMLTEINFFSSWIAIK